jgi:hypothetical protein
METIRNSKSRDFELMFSSIKFKRIPMSRIPAAQHDFGNASGHANVHVNDRYRELFDFLKPRKMM